MEQAVTRVTAAATDGSLLDDEVPVTRRNQVAELMRDAGGHFELRTCILLLLIPSTIE